ncbi:MAG TPA: hypothetical protein PKD12_24180 [Nitrospira sp.]|nr:hypothetical protein [Nitrospira sp.]
MAVTYDVVDDGRVVLQYWSGQVTRDEVVAHEHQHLTDPRITPRASVIVDARQAQFGIAEHEVRDIIDGLYALYPHPLKIKKCALLVNDVTYPLAQAYEASGGKYGLNIVAFHSLDIACTWLGLDAKMVSSHLERLRQVRAALPREPS